jgi:tRNA(fMet)-specific endonuclease VapC
MNPRCVSDVNGAKLKPTRKKLLVLDTNHFSEWERHSAAGQKLSGRLRLSRREMSLTIVTVEEELRGWLAEINRYHDLDRQIIPYSKLQRQVNGFSEWTILGWDAESAALFRRFRAQGIRIGTMDLKIACIALAHDATLLTRNTVDFMQVPGLRHENWLD